MLTAEQRIRNDYDNTRAAYVRNLKDLLSTVKDELRLMESGDARPSRRGWAVAALMCERLCVRCEVLSDHYMAKEAVDA